MSKKIAIILKANSDNNYSFHEISNIYHKDNNISITNNNYNKLATGEEVELHEMRLTPGLP